MEAPKARQSIGPIKAFTLILATISITARAQLQFSNELPISNKAQREPVEATHLIVNGTTILSSSEGLGIQNGNSLPYIVDGSSQLAPTNVYSSVQAQKFRVNVSNICEKNRMRATIRMSRPFYGLIHTKDKRRRPACSLDGNGDQSYAMEISYTLNPLDPNHCGVVSHQLQPARNQSTSTVANSNQQQQQVSQKQPQLTLSVVLVVRLHKSIEFSDDRYFLLSCANRCTRPDCSAPNNFNNQPEESPAHLVSAASGLQVPLRSPFVASESVVSPMVRTQDDGNRSTLEQLQRLAPSLAWPTERCDTMLDLKFQWLVKLCWILSTLLAVILCATLYMCSKLGGKTDKGDKNGPKEPAKMKSAHSGGGQRNTNNLKAKSMSLNTKQQVIYSPPTQSENISWAETQNTNVASSDCPQHHHLVNQMRDDNNNNLYLTKQQQQQQQRQLLLANLSFMNSQTEGERRLQALDHHSRQPVLGRLAEASSASQPQLAARVKRRRSIGSSMAAPGYQDSSDGYHVRGSNQATRTSMASQRAKSRSQTTIYYEQSQDPFQTVPFNYNLNHQYQSDGENLNRVYLDTEFTGTEVYGMPPSVRAPLEPHLQTFITSPNRNSAESMSHSIPPETHVLPSNHQTLQNTATSTINRLDMFRKQGLRTNLKPSFVAPPQVDDIKVQGTRKMATQAQQQQQQQHQPNSQFDPQNSRQLIDLIQRKHRQQIEQANMTAANMHPSEIFLEIQRQQPPNQSSQQLNNVPMVRPSWR